MRADELIQAVLNEDRMPALHAKWGAKLNTAHDENVHGGVHPDRGRQLAISRVAGMDPTGNKQYTDRLLHWYHQGQYRLEDHPRITHAIDRFHRLKGRLPADRRDINRYGSIHELEQHVDALGDVKTKSDVNAEEKRDIEHGSSVIHDSPRLQVREIHNKAAACGLGVGTKWCTAVRNEHNMFDEYRKHGQLYSIHDKESGRKYQVHFNAGQLMDENDVPVSANGLAAKHPALVDLFHGRHAGIFSDHARLERSALAMKPGVHPAELLRSGERPGTPSLEHVKAFRSTDLKPGEQHHWLINARDTSDMYNQHPAPTPLRTVVASHTKTSPQTLDKMFDQGHEMLVHMDARRDHPNFTPLEAMQNTEHREAIAQEHLGMLKRSGSMLAGIEATHPQVSKTTLMKMVSLPHVDTRVAMAALNHPRSDSDVKRAAASNPHNEEVRYQSARMVDLPSAMVEKLHTDPSGKVREIVMRHPKSTRAMHLKAIETANDPDTVAAVVNAAVRTPRDVLPATLHQIVRKAVEHPKPYDRGMKNGLFTALSAEQLPEATQRWFLRSGYHKLKRSTVPGAARFAERALRYLAVNDNVHPDVVTHIAKRHLHTRAGRDALFHSRVPEASVRAIMDDPRRPKAHRALAGQRQQFGRDHILRGGYGYSSYLNHHELEDQDDVSHWI